MLQLSADRGPGVVVCMFYAVRYSGLLRCPARSLERTGDFARFVAVCAVGVFGVRGFLEGVHGRVRADLCRGSAATGSGATEASPAPEGQAPGPALSTDLVREDVRQPTDLWEVAGAHVVSFSCFTAGVFCTVLLSYIRRARRERVQQRSYRDMGSQTIGSATHTPISSSSSTLSSPPASVSGSPARARKGVYGGFHSA